MKNRVLRNISFGLSGVVVVILMVATILENLYGTTFVIQKIYTSPWMIALWGVTAISALVYLIKSNVHRRVITFMLHVSFLVILAGALITHICGVQGALHLRVGEEPVKQFVMNDGMVADFPFGVELKSFELINYKGSMAPMDYKSEIVITDDHGAEIQGVVSMNNIFSHKSYRFYQSSYDRDGQGSVLAISYDPYGIAVTYTGYLLLLLSILLFFFQKGSVYRALFSNPLLKRGVAIVAIFLCCAMTADANELPRVLPKHIAERFGELYVYHNDRICPMQTLAVEFTSKIYGKPTYKGLTAEQVLTGWFFYYDSWKNEPMIKIKGGEVSAMLGIKGKYAALTDFTDVRGYKLDRALESTDLQLRQNVNAANEKFNLISMLSVGSMWKLYPYQDSLSNNITWFSLADKLPSTMPDNQWIFVKSSMNNVAEKIALKDNEQILFLLDKIKTYQEKYGGEGVPTPGRYRAERLYNSSNIIRPLFMFCLTVSLLSFALCCRRVVRGRAEGKIEEVIYTVLMSLLFMYLTFHITLRGIVSNHLPLSNGYETMLFMAWCSALLTLIMRKKFYLAFPFGMFLCGLTTLVATLGQSNPRITQLMPVLHSPWLSVHVVTIMIAYSLLAFAMMNGITAFIVRYSGANRADIIEYLHVVSKVMLYPAIFLLAIGIFIGAVWANVAWGRYWGWDPKEVWALITMLVYSVALHSASLPWLRRPMAFHLFCIVAFLTVLITYFGVNFFLGGMHSYA